LLTPHDVWVVSIQSAAVPDPLISVVIPTLDEEASLGPCLDSIGSPADVEIVVSDGGSQDRTLEIAASRPHVRVVSGPPGRGGQLRRGAAAAGGEVLLFLHADCRLPAGWHQAVQNALAAPGVALASFRLHTEPTDPAAAGRVRRLWLRLLDLRSYGGALPYGDQGMAVRRSTYDQIGGFRPIPLMEDVEFVRDARAVGRVEVLPLEVRTTARRVERHPLRNRLMTATFPWLYRVGVSPERLASWYRHVR
jgi:rSAM/selenodomain-associated transferase 2